MARAELYESYLYCILGSRGRSIASPCASLCQPAVQHSCCAHVRLSDPAQYQEIIRY